MRRLGCLAGTEKIAGQAAREYQEHYQRLETRYAHPKKSLRVFYQVWPMPLMTVTKRSWIDEVITLCGGKNIFADLHGVAPEINIEAVLAADPDIILGTNSKALQQWQAWPTLRAVQRKQVYVIHSDLIERASPRILDGVQEMCRQFAAGEALLQTFPQ
jgi:iron complex transport system substrate-binding protein